MCIHTSAKYPTCIPDRTHSGSYNCQGAMFPIIIKHSQFWFNTQPNQLTTYQFVSHISHNIPIISPQYHAISYYFRWSAQIVLIPTSEIPSGNLAWQWKIHHLLRWFSQRTKPRNQLRWFSHHGVIPAHATRRQNQSITYRLMYNSVMWVKQS